ncbi:hypothetical protein Tco_0772042 [Tanacetum coccineum]|uniref:Uncharacterized protein n=1 Tax=Tanacetum coccineum TaxID=301880 RepID=A0ABQ4ZI57_9ASTR
MACAKIAKALHDGQHGQPRLDVFGELPLLVGRHHVHCDHQGSRSTTLKDRKPLRRLGNLPSIHLESEKLELDKQEVKQPEVDRFDLAEPGVGKLELD